jgi:glycosyltransferase involved in cell wall biosynthesis
MKTLFFCNLIPGKTGAFERVLAELGAFHSRHGDHLILALAGEPIPEVAEWFHQAGVEWRIIPGWSEAGGRVHPWRFVAPALRLLRDLKPDVAVVHFGNELPSLAVCLLAPLVGRRGIKWVWQQDQQMAPPGWITSRLSRIRLLGLGVDRFVAVYEGGRQSLVQRSILPERITVIHNGTADPDPMRNQARARDLLGADDGTVLLLGVGSMISRKRQDFLVNVFSRIAAGPETGAVRLVLIGDGPERQRLEHVVRAKGLEGGIVFMGRRNDVSTLLCGADGFVHAAVAEGCAYVLAEAMAAGLPVVVTDAGAAREQVEDGTNGFVVGRDDESGFAERVIRLVRNKALRQKMGVASRQRWERLFKVERQAEVYWETYRG